MHDDNPLTGDEIGFIIDFNHKRAVLERAGWRPVMGNGKLGHEWRNGQPLFQYGGIRLNIDAAYKMVTKTK